jgi:hypothetical protein
MTTCDVLDGKRLNTCIVDVANCDPNDGALQLVWNFRVSRTGHDRYAGAQSVTPPIVSLFPQCTLALTPAHLHLTLSFATRRHWPQEES